MAAMIAPNCEADAHRRPDNALAGAGDFVEICEGRSVGGDVAPSMDLDDDAAHTTNDAVRQQIGLDGGPGVQIDDTDGFIHRPRCLCLARGGNPLRPQKRAADLYQRLDPG